MSMTPEQFEEKRQARIDRLNRAAERASQQSDSDLARARKMGSVIPFGQPVHGQRDRNYREKIGRTIDKAYVEYQQAQAYTRRAQAAENNDAIFSDDPQATEKLKPN